ncbi:connector enhancer of kinase suppressor of ras 2-like isoform X9 [Branchiostoma floridae]|uniref:Connector enhancer of kinase suppressor of ras 2-like isoform X9 n=1 Tax=Branchiostoma floridae TaxID=7739 RepID=A0A9J7LQV5_BRAFL|nr:connector enhancer of kinase suppressor of ras 2-like isoform X9 [Branchiostoma floridae]
MANSMESVGSWTPKQVGLWLKGLDDAVQPYIQSFILAGVTGEQLLNLSHRDMDRLNITKLGHQELILEAVDLLCALNFGLENETLQSLTVALGLNVENLDMAMTVRNQQSILVGLAGPRDNYKLPPDILRAICDVLSAAKAVVSWLDRTPFVQMMNYIAIRNRIVRICLGFTSSIHKDPNKRDAEETVVPLCKELAMLSQSLQLSVKDDPQVCSAARVEVITLTNVDHKLGLGMFIQSSFNGTHYVTGTKEGSPAYTCKRIHPGDEILQVNYQTVVGWKLKKLVDALKEDPHGVVITFKKRPKTSRSSGTPSRPSSGSSSRLSQNSRHSSGNHIRGRSLDSASPANSVGRVPPSPLVELYLPPPPPEPYKPRQNFFDRVRTPTSNITQSQVQVHQPLWEDEDMSPPPPQPLSDRSQSVHIPTHRQDQQATWEDSEEEGASIDSVSTVVTRSPVSPASPQWEEGEGLSPTRPLPLGARSPNYLLDRQSKYRRSATFSEGTENHDPSFRLAQETRETLREAMLRARQNRKDRPRERPKSLPPDTGMQGFRAGGEREERREVSNQRLSDHVRMEVETISEASTSAESSPQRSVPPRPLSQPDSAPRPLSADREVIVIDKQNAIKDFVPSNLRKLTGDMSSMPAFRVERETRPRGKNASRGPPPPYERSRMDGRHSFKSVPEVSKLPMDEVARRTRPLTEQFSAKLAIFEGGSESNVMKRPQRKHFAERVSELQEAVKSPAKDESKEEEEESNFQRGVVGKAETDDSTIRTTRYVHRISLRFKKDKDKSESAGANPEGASPQAADSEPANVLPVSVQPSKQSFRKESPEVANLDDIQSRFAPSPIVPPPNQERLVREKTKQFTRRMDPVESARIVEQEPSYSGSPNKEVKYDTPPFPDQRDSVREARTNPTVQKQEVLPKSPTSAPGSYSVKIVGGVPVRIGSTSHVQQNMNTAKNPFCSCLSPSYSRVSFQMPPPDQSSVRLRSKNKVTGTQKYSRRRMSCKDLGNGDCEGWLWKKKDQRKIFGQKWKKLWFVLKKFSLYYYAGQDALKAEGIINLPEYSVVYATDTECGRKFGIKASHMEIKTFFFATDSKEDRDRWLNKLQLASIQYDRQSIHDPELNILELAKQCPAIVEGFGYYSESDEESEPPSPNPVSPTRQSPSPPRKRKESSPERPVFDDTPVVSPVATAPVGNSMKRSREKPRKPSYLAAFDMNGTKKSPPSERKSPSNPPRPPYDPPRPPHDPPRPPSNPPVEQWGQLSTTSSDSECTHVTPISSTSSSSSTASSPMLLLPPPPQFGSTDELKNLYRQSWNVLQEEKMMKMLELGQGNLSEKQEKKLKLQKLTRVLKDKEGNLEAIDRLLKSPQLTSREVQDWKDQNQHILEDVEKHKDGADPPQRPPSTSSRHNSQSGPVPKPRTSIHRNSQGPIEEMTQRLSITKRPLSTDLDRIESDAGIKPPLPEIDDDEDDSYSSTSL